MIHHYTSINTLALILKNKSIRFNRLDRVDDVSESEAYGNYELGKFIFVSCWTDSATESIPLWHMYTNGMRGVKITINRDWMYYRPLQPDPKYKLITQGNPISPLTFEQMCNDKYFVLPNFIEKKTFLKPVSYVDNPSEYYKNAVSVKIEADGKANMEIKNINDFATYKQKIWSFQEEVRYALFVMPAIPIPQDGFSNQKYIQELPNHIMNSIINGKSPDLNYLDVDIDPRVLSNITVTLGPLCDAADEIVVKSLLNEYTNNGKLLKSKLTGNIRQPKR